MSHAERETIGFIGIGLMGRPMVSKLLAAGYRVNVWNRSAEKLADVVALGAVAADSMVELVNNSDLILLCLANTEVVEHCVFAEAGVAAAARPEHLLVDLSSIEPTACRDFAARLHAATGTHWVDAPVSNTLRRTPVTM